MIRLQIRLFIFCLLIIAAGLLNTGCNTIAKTQQGAAIGAGTGSIVGAFIGKFAGNPSLGAIIGGAVGGTAGAFIGRNLDRQATDIIKNVPDAKVTRQGDSIIVKFSTGLLFEPGTAKIDTLAQFNLKNLAATLKKNPQANITVIGHTDDRGEPAYNMELSAKRADSVKAYLAYAGVNPTRINTEAKGSADPVADNKTASGRAQNRRADIIITAADLKKKADYKDVK